MNKVKDLKREKANFALRKINEIKTKDFASKFKSHISNLPMYIYSDGIIATYAFILKKSDKKISADGESYRKIKEIIEEILGCISVNLLHKEKEELLECLIEIKSSEYRTITLKVLSYLEWIIRFADGMIEDEDDITPEEESR